MKLIVIYDTYPGLLEPWSVRYVEGSQTRVIDFCDTAGEALCLVEQLSWQKDLDIADTQREPA